MYTYDSPSLAINDLAKRGYNKDFNVSKTSDKIVTDGLLIEGKPLELSPDEFVIDEIYRFEGDSDPGDETVVYAISSKKHKVKGVLINAFGPYSSSEASAIIRKLSAHILHQPQYS